MSAQVKSSSRCYKICQAGSEPWNSATHWRSPILYDPWRWWNIHLWPKLWQLWCLYLWHLIQSDNGRGKLYSSLAARRPVTSRTYIEPLNMFLNYLLLDTGLWSARIIIQERQPSRYTRKTGEINLIFAQTHVKTQMCILAHWSLVTMMTRWLI